MPIAAMRVNELRQRAGQIACVRAFGLTLVEFDEGFCRLRARHIREFDGVYPYFHGGMLATVADCAAWFAIATQTGPDEPMVTSDLTIHYLRPCQGDATAEARVIKLGKRLCPTRVDLHDPEGLLVATATVTYMRIAAEG